MEGQLPATNVYVVHDVSWLMQLNRLREELLYSVAHELRAPLAVLSNALAILGEDYGGLSAAEFDRLTGSAQRTAARLHTLMEDLLSAGNIQAGRFRVAPKPVPVLAIVEAAVEFIEPVLEQRRQIVESELPAAHFLVQADQRYARQVLANLLSNASKYSPEGATIRIRAAAQADSVRLAVEDRGRGIPTEEQDGLFERFYRVRGEHEEPGIGLGLAIAKGIVEAHGGQIGVESDLGRGTTVWFTLPLSIRQAASQTPAEPISAGMRA